MDVTILTDDETTEPIAARFAREGLHFEGLRLLQAADYARTYSAAPAMASGVPAPCRGILAHEHGRHGQPHLGGLERELLEIPDWRVDSGGPWRSSCLRLSRLARKALVRLQMQYVPKPGIYDDLLDRLKPDLVIASTPGWRLDRYLLREAKTQWNSDGNRDRRMGQSFKLRHSRGSRGLGHVLVGSPEGRAGAWV